MNTNALRFIADGLRNGNPEKAETAKILDMAADEIDRLSTELATGRRRIDAVEKGIQDMFNTYCVDGAALCEFCIHNDKGCYQGAKPKWRGPRDENTAND